MEAKDSLQIILNLDPSLSQVVYHPIGSPKILEVIHNYLSPQMGERSVTLQGLIYCAEYMQDLVCTEQFKKDPLLIQSLNQVRTYVIELGLSNAYLDEIISQILNATEE